MFAEAHAGRKIRVGIVGVGNCASSLVQGLTYYKGLRSNTPVPGVMKSEAGGLSHRRCRNFVGLRCHGGQSRPGRCGCHLGRAKQYVSICRCERDGNSCAARADARWTWALHSKRGDGIRPAGCKRAGGVAGKPNGGGRFVFAGRVDTGDGILRRRGAGSRVRVHQLHSCFYCIRSAVEAAL